MSTDVTGPRSTFWETDSCWVTEYLFNIRTKYIWCIKYIFY